MFVPTETQSLTYNMRLITPERKGEWKLEIKVREAGTIPLL